MYKKLKLVTNESINLKVKNIENFEYAKGLTQCVVTADEFFRVSKSQPIVFAKNSDGDYFASAILGLEENKNNFMNDNNEWVNGEYTPAYIRRYPFIFVKKEEQFALAYDEECSAINEEEGQALFDKDSKQTEYTQNVLKFMNGFQQSSLQTIAFINELDKLGILEEANADIQAGDKRFAFQGFKRVNEEKLGKLTREKTMKLIKNGYYKLIVAHLISMTNFEKLVALQK